MEVGEVPIGVEGFVDVRSHLAEQVRTQYRKHEQEEAEDDHDIDDRGQCEDHCIHQPLKILKLS